MTLATAASLDSAGYCLLGEVLEPSAARSLHLRLLEDLDTHDRDRREDYREPGQAAHMTVLYGWWSRQGEVVQSVSSVLGRVAASALGSRSVELFSDEAFVKPARSGAGLHWHQDYSVHAYDDRRHLTFWVALTDVTQENGPVEVATGTHRLGKYVPNRIRENESLQSPVMRKLLAAGLPDLPDPDRLSLTYDLLVMPAGHASVHDYLLWHRSSPNWSDTDRVGVALRFRPALADHQ